MYKYALIIMLSVTSISSSCGQSFITEENEVFDGIKNLEIKGSFCQVTITGNESDQIFFQGEIKGYSSNSDFAIRHKISGDQLTIWVDTPTKSWNNVNGKLTFNVPADCNIFVNNSSGSIQVSQLQYGGLVLESTSGSIKSNNTKTNARMKASSGSINVNQHEGNLELTSSSGSQKLAGIIGDVSTRSSSGSINIQNIQGKVQAEASSGSIQLADVIGGAVVLKTSSGSINGKGVQLTHSSSFTSSSGSISITLLNDIHNLSFNLSAGSGSLNVNGERRTKTFVRESGKIWIKGSSSSGSQNYQVKPRT